ncbi:MAG: choice-of-anchor L domain-containing protein [Pseudomonadota bacterium]
MARKSIAGWLVVPLMLAGTSYANALSVNAVTAGADAALLAQASLAANSGITIVGGSETYTGADDQGGTFSDFSLSNSTTNISIQDGVVLTSGDATGIVVSDNTDTSFDADLQAPGDPGLDTLIGTTNDANVLSFEFTVDPGITSVSANFVFGTEEFPDQSFTDIFAVFVDGQNFAEFSDGTLISFQDGMPSEAFFNDNDVDILDPFSDGDGNEFQYDGITDVLTVTGLLDQSLTTHTISIAIADTLDFIFDSGVFFAGLTAGTETDGGITPPTPVPLPATIWLMIAAFCAFGVFKRRV